MCILISIWYHEFDPLAKLKKCCNYLIQATLLRILIPIWYHDFDPLVIFLFSLNFPTATNAHHAHREVEIFLSTSCYFLLVLDLLDIAFVRSKCDLFLPPLTLGYGSLENWNRMVKYVLVNCILYIISIQNNIYSFNPFF